MAAQSYKIPPRMTEQKSYDTWKNEIKMWRLVTELDKKKQALAIALSLTGKAREAALEIPAENLNSDDGVDKLLEKLDQLFKKDTIDSAYEAYKNFDAFYQGESVPMTDYIAQFEILYRKMEKYEMKLPDAILAFTLLEKANLEKKDRQMALTACSDIKYETMKSALKRIFGDQHKRNQAVSLGLGKLGSGLTSSDMDMPNVDKLNIDGRPIKQELTEEVLVSSYQTQGYRSGRNRVRPRYRSKPSTDDSIPGTNPINRYGKRTKCAICQSIFHWAKDCPHKEQSANVVESVEGMPLVKDRESVNITLFAKHDDRDKHEILMAEAYGAAVIDTACTKTVCGNKWLNEYTSRLGNNENFVSRSKSSQEFRFGDGVNVMSSERVTIPAVIGDTHCNISTEVVDCDIPLLLSKESLKRADTVLDLSNDTAVMFGKPVALDFTSSGHYCVSLRNMKELPLNVQSENTYGYDTGEVLQTDSPVDIEQDSEANEENVAWDSQKLMKLHRQFGHAAYEKLGSLLKDAGVSSKATFDLLKTVVKDCKICQKFKRAPPKPAVCLPLANEFNEVVAMDLHELGPSLWYLHFIDLFTRYSAATLITSKRASVIVQKFLQIWISVHGSPKSILSDNGREFNNEEMRDLAENFNIIVRTTPAESPWSNGLLERHNRTLTDILNKVKCDQSIDLETALAWSVSAKNCLNNTHGYSSHQLVYGANPNLPTTLTDKSPALEGTTMSLKVANHLNALHVARKGFIEAESSERIRRALRKQIRTYDNFVTGDQVYYKRADSDEWKGPGVVIGQDGVVVFVRHGGTYVRVHRCRLTKVNSTTTEKEKVITEVASDKISRSNTLTNTLNEEERMEEEMEVESDNEIEHKQSSEKNGNDGKRSLGTTLPKIGQQIQYTGDNGEPTVIKVLSRAGKASGRLKHWFNIEYVQPEAVAGVQKSIDLDSICEPKLLEENIGENHEEEHVLLLDHVQFDKAKREELKKWKDFKVYKEIEDTGQRCISTRWVCTFKEMPQGQVPKARLVARGFEDSEKDCIKKDSPTCCKESLRLFLAIAAQRNWCVNSMDIKTAFLQGSPLHRNVYIRPPQEADTNKIWHLQKCVYGLGDASLHWYDKVKKVMIDCGGKVSKMDPAVFYWFQDGGGLLGLLASHVDDFIWTGNTPFEDAVIKKIRSILCVGEEASTSFQYIGLHLSTKADCLHLDQKDYINNLQTITVRKERAKKKGEGLLDNEKDAMRSKIGQIIWVANQTRPDVMFEASTLSSSIKNGTVSDLLEVNKVIRKIKSESVSLKFHHLGRDDSLKLVIYSDASLGNLRDGGSQGGYFIFLAGENGLISPLAWQSKKVRRIVRSTLAAETLAMADAVDTGIFLGLLYSELTKGNAAPNILPLTCITDNHSLFDNLHSTNHVGEKRLRIEINGIKELMASGHIAEVRWSEAKGQIADCLTKKGASSLGLLRLIEEGSF